MTGLRLVQIGGLGPLYRPAEDGPVPAILILHGAEGAGSGWSHRFAAILAAHGFAALPYAYGAGDVFGAGDIRGVDISAIPKAGRVLAAQAGVAGVGLLGWSRGGELALHVAALGGPDLPFRAVAAHAPADRCIGAFDLAAFRTGASARPEEPDGPRAWVWQGHEAALTPGTPIAIEAYRGPVFLSVGDADEVWGHEMTQTLAARLTAVGRPPDLWIAPGQGHAFDFATEPELWRRLTGFFTTHLREAGG
jgi:dienelactone hydrolase